MHEQETPPFSENLLILRMLELVISAFAYLLIWRHINRSISEEFYVSISMQNLDGSHRAALRHIPLQFSGYCFISN